MDTPNIEVSSSLKSARYSPFGSITFWQETNQGIIGTTSTGKFKITVYSSGLIRIQASRFQEYDTNPYAVVLAPQKEDFMVSDENEMIWIKTKLVQLRISKDKFLLTFFDHQGNILNEDDSLGISWIGTEVTTYKKVQENEKFIGLGEKTGNLNRFGNAYTNWNTDYFAYGTGDDPLYMSIPFYLGIHANGSYGIFFDNPHKSVFNFGASTNRFVYFNGEDGDMDYYFFHEPTVAEIISSYTRLTGRMEMPPKWSLGFQQCRYSYYPEKEVTTLASTFRDKDMPADVIYLDIHHMEAYKVFTFDGVKFPDAKAMISDLKKKGFRVVVIMDPGIKTEKGYPPYDEGTRKDLFVKYPDGIDYEGQVWPGWCAFPDFTKAETRSWWAEKMSFYSEAGVDGFWTDMNEPASWGQFTPNLIDFDFEGEHVSHRKARNIYGMQMARAAQEGAIVQNSEERAFVLTRSGYAGIQRYAAAWTGDNIASEEHMMAGIRLINSLGISGVAFSGYDVGGFAGESSKSLFARWMSIGAFSPLYRAHSMINSNDAEPWAFGEEVEEISRNYMKLRYRLLPTIYSSFHKAVETGLPLVSSLAINYPLDEKIYHSAYQNEYIFCDRFLVAPVESYKEIIKAYLPEGNWYYLYSDKPFSGNQEVYIDTPINYLPVFVKGGSIFTMQSDVSFSNQKNDGVLRVHVYAGENGSSFTHYEDDGISHSFKEGDFHLRTISYDAKQGIIELSKASGDFESEYGDIECYFHGFAIKEIAVNGETISVEYKDYAFLGKLTEFDPLPENDHPYFDIKGLPFIQLKYSSDKLTFSGLRK